MKYEVTQGNLGSWFLVCNLNFTQLEGIFVFSLNFRSCRWGYSLHMSRSGILRYHVSIARKQFVSDCGIYVECIKLKVWKPISWRDSTKMHSFSLIIQCIYNMNTLLQRQKSKKFYGSLYIADFCMQKNFIEFHFCRCLSDTEKAP